MFSQHRLQTVLCCALGFIISSARADTVYENYTFTTFAGPSESGPGWHDGPGDLARFDSAFGMGLDANGNIFLADTANNTVRKITPDGHTTTVAGVSFQQGSSDGLGAAARFKTTACTAVDASGNIYVADSDNHTIRKITPTGLVSTLAGVAGSHGTNDGAGSAARFYTPGGVAVDTNGFVYVADSGNHAIRKISPAGVVSTFAGFPGLSGSANGTGTGARFYSPENVAVDKNGTVYVADTVNHTIRKITPAGVVATLAGLAGNAGTLNGTGSAARFYYPCGVAVHTNGIVYVADTYSHTIRKITSAGAVSTLAGSAGNSGTSDGTNATARFNYPSGVGVNSSGTVYVTDTANYMLRTITPGGVVTTLAGRNRTTGSADGTGGAARFNYPSSLSAGPGGVIYVCDYVNNTIRKISPLGDVTTFAGLAGHQGTNDGHGSAARFQSPVAVAASPGGDVYVADTYNHLIRKITASGDVTTIAGKAGVIGTNNGPGLSARFNNPSGIAVDANTNVYVADTFSQTIRKISPSGQVTTLAGSAGNTGSSNGSGAAARFNYPLGLAVDVDGNIYVADQSNSSVRKVTPTGDVTTLAGTNGATGNTDGTGSDARFKYPFGLSVDQGGNVLVADTYNHTIRKITQAGVTTTVGGTPGTYGTADGSGSGAGFSYPESVAVDSSGIIYVADSSSHAIRKGNPTLTDVPFANPAFGDPGILHQLNVSNVTTTTWSWSFVRYPTASAADLSSANIQNPTLTPDIADLYTVRFDGTDAQGHVAVGTVTLGTTIPQLAISSPTSGQRWSNSVFTVTGTASDNLDVAAVWCQVNTDNWVLASGTNNWSASVNLSPGTNVIRAYALNVAGYSSATNSVSFVYIPSDVLQIQMYGRGTISPNYSNRLVEIGRVLTITATAGNGHKFNNWVVSTNWVGGTISTNRALTFTMQSNLTLQVNFLDIVKPTLSITSPTAGQRVTNVDGQITVKGKANDNGHIAAVQYQLNGAAWTDATTTNGWTNWTAVINPLPRTNVLKAYAVDGDGNKTTTNSVSFIYVVTNPITFFTNGVGTISRTFGNILEVGKTYSATAVPGNGEIFSYWGGSLTATNAGLTFIMQSNMVLQANFIPNPFLPVKGDYKGLFGETVRTHEHSGFISLSLADHGAYTASLLRGTNTYPFSGQFDFAGNASKTVNSWLVSMTLDFGAQRITGTASGTNFVSDLLANRSVFNAATNPATAYAGKYTVSIPGTANDPSTPSGDGYLTLLVGNGGNATVNGTLADANTLSQVVPVSGDGLVPLYQSRYAGKGSVWGWLSFDTNSPAATLSGDVSWIKQPVPGATYYPHGFTNAPAVEGSRYTPPATVNTRVINLTNGVAIFEGGNLSSPFTNVVTLTQSNRVINGSANSLTLSITLTNGVFSGSVKVPGTTRTNTFKGALLQNQNSGTGYFLGTNQSGWVYLGPPL